MLPVSLSWKIYISSVSEGVGVSEVWEGEGVAASTLPCFDISIALGVPVCLSSKYPCARDVKHQIANKTSHAWQIEERLRRRAKWVIF